MLANLASLLWGGETTMPAPDTTTTLGCPEAPDTLAKFNIRATTPVDEEEADWLLVDRADVGEACVVGGDGHGTNLQASSISQHQQAAAAAPSETITPTTITTTAAATITKTTRANVSLTLNNNMKSTPVAGSSIPTTPTCGGVTDGNEWLMTPPPCFTRSQADPLTTSPLEDLLIEHPSMSVYLPRPNTTYTTTASTTKPARLLPRVMSHSVSPPPPSASPCSQPASIVAESEDSPMRESCDNVIQPVVTTTTAVASTTTSSNRSSGVAHRSASLLQAIDVLRPTQKAQRRREERRLKRKSMERSNKVRQVASESNKPSRRRNMMAPAKFSRAVNNRKC